MGKKILVNGITLNGGNLIPLLTKINYRQNCGFEVSIFGNQNLFNQINSLNILNKYDAIEFSRNTNPNNRILFMLESLYRNLIALLYINKLRNRFDYIYTISSVLDLVIFPVILKLFDKRIQWHTVFDNTVPFSGPGLFLIRVLAWLFFKISMLFVKKADKINVISNDLYSYLINKGFSENKLIITGNAIEVDLIKSAQFRQEYASDSLFIGRINEAKGIYDMLEVISIIIKQYPKFKLMIMGEGDEIAVNNYKQRIVEKGLEKNIVFLGYKSGQEKFDIIKSAKSFLFLSYTESFGVSLMEAVYSGLYAFVYDLPVYKTIYQNNEINTFKKGDFNGIAQAMINLFEQNSFINTNGIEYKNVFTWDKIADLEFKRS